MNFPQQLLLCVVCHSLTSQKVFNYHDFRGEVMHKLLVLSRLELELSDKSQWRELHQGHYDFKHVAVKSHEKEDCEERNVPGKRGLR